jgi:hypothetical protein
MTLRDPFTEARRYVTSTKSAESSGEQTTNKPETEGGSETRPRKGLVSEYDP